MAPANQVAVCDSFSARYADWTAFAQSLVDAIAIEWRQVGVTGARVVDADLDEAVLTIVTRPDKTPLTVTAVRQFLHDKRQTNKAAA